MRALLLLILIATWAYSGIVTYWQGVFLELGEASIDGRGGAGIVLPNAVELWARQLVFYINATRAAQAYYNMFTGELLYVSSPTVHIYFTVRLGTAPVVASWKEQGNDVFSTGGLERVTKRYTAEPGLSRVYLVQIKIYAGARAGTYTIYEKTRGAVPCEEQAPVQRSTSVEVVVYDISPSMIGKEATPVNVGVVVHREVIYRSYFASRYPDYVVARTYPNGTLRITLVNVYVCRDGVGELANVTRSIDIGGDPWIWISPKYPTAAYIAAVSAYFDQIISKMPWMFHPIIYLTSDVIFGEKNLILYNCENFGYVCGALEFSIFIGNETLALAPVAYPLFVGVGAMGEARGGAYTAAPGRFVEACKQRSYSREGCAYGQPAEPLWDLRGKNSTICIDGNCIKAPAGLLFAASPSYVVKGEFLPTPFGYAVVGKVDVRRLYSVSVVLPNGTLTFRVPWGETFVYTPPRVIELSNRTRYVGSADVKITVMRDLVLFVNYTRLYSVTVITPFGINETWVPEGAVVEIPEVSWDLGNGTTIFQKPVSITADRPYIIKPNYTVYYRIDVYMPNGTVSYWVKRGEVFIYNPPPVIDFGNNTRLLGAEPCELRADRPTNCTARYTKRQFYVVVYMLNKTWEDWVDEGALVEDLNVDTGVVNAGLGAKAYYKAVYVAEPLVVKTPGKHKLRYRVEGWVSVGDALGVHIPMAEVKLCNSIVKTDWSGVVNITAVSESLCRPEVRAPPFSPYVVIASVASAVAGVAYFYKRRRGE